MINKRKLDEVIQKATEDRERDCAYSVEEYWANKDYQRHVCEYVRHCCMPYLLAKYLYEDCYYNDFKTVQANLNYINSATRNEFFFETWNDITIDVIYEEIRGIEAEKTKEYYDNLSDDDDDFDSLN